MADWMDWIFGKKALKDAASQGSASQPQQGPPANIDIGKMAQAQADKDKPQLKGVGAAPSKSCPTCGAPMKDSQGSPQQ